MILTNDNFKINAYEQDIVILDVKKDSYTIFENGNFNKPIESLHKIFRESLSELMQLGVVSETMIVSSQDCAKDFLEERWIKPPAKASRYNILLLVRCLIQLKSCERIINSDGFVGVKSKILNSREGVLGDIKSIDRVMSHLNLVYPYSNNTSNCLTYSFCLTLLLLQRKINAKLVLGVRTRPFFSHAWVEVDGEVINDDKFLRNKLSVIWEI